MDKNVKWNYYKLDSVAKLVSGRTPEREQKEYYADAGTPWVKIENLDQGYIMEAAEYLSPQGREKVNLVPENSVLFSIVGTVGKVGIAGRELATNQQIVALIFDESRVLPLYGYYFLCHHAEAIRKLSNQTTMALISRKTLGQYRICVPDSLDAQREIVDKLEKFKKYVEKKEYLRRQMGSYESLLFGKIFQKEIRYHEKMSVREILSEPVTAGIPKNEEPDGRTENEFPCIRSAEFVHAYLDAEVYDRWERGRDSRICTEPAYQVQEGDVLLRNGRLLLMGKAEFPICYERNILRIRTRREQLLPEVLYAYMNLPGIQQVLYGERKAGDTRKRPIRASELERMEIPYFSMEKQREFAACLRKIRCIQQSLDKEILYARKAFEIACKNLLSARALNGQEMKRSKEQELPEHTGLPEEQRLSEPAGLPEEQKLPEPAALPKVQATDGQTGAAGDAVSRLILAVLCGWSPMDERTGAYCKKRQEIFRKAQPLFQPVAFSLVTGQGQEEYLLERDFLAYHSPVFCQADSFPLDCLRDLLRKKAEGGLLDAHLAFQGENGIRTEADWDRQTVEAMAREGLLLLAEYSGLADCCFLFKK